MTTRTGRAPDARPAPRDPHDGLPWRVDVRESVLVGEVLGVSPQVCRARWADLPSVVAHGLARLRVDVGIAEADRAYPDLDDADLDPATEHLWVPDGDVPVALLRVVRGPDGVPCIDRACARADLRRLGLTSALVTDVVARRGAGPLHALARPGTLAFLGHHGFEVCGEPVPSPAGPLLPMRRHPEAPWRY